MDVREQRREWSGKCNVMQGVKWVLYALRMPHSECSGKLVIVVCVVSLMGVRG